MLFCKHKNNRTSEQNLRLNSNDIKSVTEIYVLGLYLNSKLNWDTHINVIGKKISRAVGIIKKLHLLFPKQFSFPCITLWYCHILITVYFHGDLTMIQSLFFFSKRRGYVSFHLLVMMLILSRFSKSITF